MTTTAENALA